MVIDPCDITVISNTGDDEILHGLHVSPDIDTVIYTLADAINPQLGWGLANETWRVMDSLAEYGGLTWFRLGDRDLATHLFRTQLLNEGETLTDVTDRIRRRWGVESRIIPATDSEMRTELVLADSTSGKRLSFQEYFVQQAHRPRVSMVEFTGADQAEPTAQAVEAIENAKAVIIAPSNPILSIAPILSIPGIRDLVGRHREKSVAVSPIIAGQAVKGPAAKLMGELGLEPSAFGVALLYRDIISTIVIDSADENLKSRIEDLGISCVCTDTLMSDDTASRRLAETALRALERR